LLPFSATLFPGVDRPLRYAAYWKRYFLSFVNL